MSELTDTVRKMLSQAASFVHETPLEAVSRAKLALRTAQTGLEKAVGEDREQLETLSELAKERIERYELQLAAWTSKVKERADQFQQNERDRLAQPLPSKI